MLSNSTVSLFQGKPKPPILLSVSKNSQKYLRTPFQPLCKSSYLPIQLQIQVQCLQVQPSRVHTLKNTVHVYHLYHNRTTIFTLEVSLIKYFTQTGHTSCYDLAQEMGNISLFLAERKGLFRPTNRWYTKKTPAFKPECLNPMRCAFQANELELCNTLCTLSFIPLAYGHIKKQLLEQKSEHLLIDLLFTLITKGESKEQ